MFRTPENKLTVERILAPLDGFGKYNRSGWSHCHPAVPKKQKGQNEQESNEEKKNQLKKHHS